MPLPLPQPEEFPFVSATPNAELAVTLAAVDFGPHGPEAKAQFRSWFDLAGRGVRDLLLFLYQVIREYRRLCKPSFVPASPPPEFSLKARAI